MFVLQVLLYGGVIVTTLLAITVVCPLTDDQLVDGHRS